MSKRKRRKEAQRNHDEAHEVSLVRLAQVVRHAQNTPIARVGYSSKRSMG